MQPLESPQAASNDAEQLRSMLACFPGMVFATDSQGVLTLLNGRNFAAAGVGSTALLLGQSVFDVFKNQPAILHSIASALNGQPCNATAGLGNLVMEVWCGPYCDSRGDVAGMLGTAVDITDRLKTGEAFRQTREMLQAVVNSSPVGLAVVDLEGKVRLWNPAAERKYGWKSEEVIGRPLPIIPPGHEGEDSQTIQKILGQGSITDEERVTMRRDGSLLPVSLSGAALHSSSGAPTGAMFVAMDLTERKRAEEALQEAKIRAEAANRAKSQFLANMSHEIRTPMNAVLGMLQLALDTPLNAEQQHYLSVARGGAESLMALLNDILDFSQIEARNLVLAPSIFDLRALLAETAETLALQAHAKGLELTCQIAPAVPVMVNGDPLRLRQVLTNLLANAVKFTPSGEVGLVVGVESDEGESLVLRFQVSDTGIGVPPDRIDSLFGPFVQGDGSSTRRFGGAGLGLTISRELVAMMSGQIGVESELALGSTFWFTAVLGKVASAPSPHENVPQLGSLKVLVVDDSGSNRALVSYLLKSWGARCHLACDGPSAFASLRRSVRSGDPFRMVVVDMSLPGMGGQELGRQIAGDPELADASLLLMTSPGQRFAPEQILQAGFSAYLFKPVLPARLAAAVQAALGTPGRTRRASESRVESSRRPARRKRVLVAEDDESSREIAVAMVEKLGYDADPVANGAEVIEALQTEMYDAVLMDCEMPVMDGLEAAARVRGWKAGAHNSGIPIIALTAHARPVDRDRCLRAGMNDFLSKPIDPHDLSHALSRWVGALAPVRGDARVFDADSLLTAAGGQQEAARIIAQFLEETPRRLAQVKGRIEDCDGLGTRAHARMLRVAAVAVSAPALSAAASDLEEAGLSCEFRRAAALLPALEEQFREFARAAQPAGMV